MSGDYGHFPVLPVDGMQTEVARFPQPGPIPPGRNPDPAPGEFGAKLPIEPDKPDKSTVKRTPVWRW